MGKNWLLIGKTLNRLRQQNWQRRAKSFRYAPFMVLLVFMLNSCLSMEYRQMSASDLQLQQLGTIKVVFNTFNFLHIPFGIKSKTYSRLLEKARREYSSTHGVDFLDVKDIKIHGSIADEYEEFIYISAITVIGWALMIPTGILFDVQTIEATGTVIFDPNKNMRVRTKSANELERIMGMVAEDLINKVPENSAIAFLSIANTPNAEYMLNELEYRFTSSNKKYRITERRRLDVIRQEQNFQMSGYVDDNSAVSIGKFLGANIVVIGEVVNVNNKQRLILKALDVQTAQIIAMTRRDW